MQTFKTYSVGTKAVFDAFTGLVKCIVTKIEGSKVYAEVVESHKAFKQGEILFSSITSSSRIVPLERVFFRGGQRRINTQFAWVNEKE